MALSGSFDNAFRSGYTLRINWSASQSVANNTSTVSVTAQLISGGSSYYISAGTVSKNISITINGSTYSGTTTATISGGATKNLFTATHPVPHNSDGTKIVSISCSFGIAVTLSGTYWNTISVSGNATLDSIARASSCSFPAMNMGTAYTISISRADNSFTHTVDYYFGNTSGQIAAKTTSTSVSWTPPLGLGSEIKTATSGTGKIVLTTYNSSGTFIGDKEFPLTLSIPDNYKPTISAINTSISNSDISTKFAGYVEGKTGVTTTITATTTNAYGATVSSYKTTILGVTYSGQTTTSGNLTSSGTVRVTCTITDSRGRTSSDYVDISVAAYSNPSISAFSAVRNTTTQTTVNCSYTFAIASVNSKNDRVMQYRRRVPGGTWSSYTSITLSAYSGSGTFNITGLSGETSHEIELYVGDYFTSTPKVVTVPTAFVTVDFLAGGKGIAIGKVAETANLLDIAMPTSIGSSLVVSSTLSVNSTVYANKIEINNGSEIHFSNTAEKQLKFINASNALRTIYMYGGASTSATVLGIWDATRNGGVWRYLNDNNLYFEVPVHATYGLNMVNATMSGRLVASGANYPQISGNGNYLHLSADTGGNGMVIDKPNDTARPASHLVESLGNISYRWRSVFSGSLDVSNTGNPYMEIRSSNGGTPFIDFSNSNGVDYHARFLLIGTEMNCYQSAFRVHSGFFANSKSAITNTVSYGEIITYCDESPNHVFTDRGKGLLDSNGVCYVFIEDVFKELVNTSNLNYWVQLTGTRTSNVYLEDTYPDYFIVKGEPNNEFNWQISAERIGTEYMRYNEAANLFQDDHELDSENSGINKNNNLEGINNDI